MSDALDNVEEAIGWEFDVKIEEGVMKITPADAGVALFGYVKLTQDDAAEYEHELKAAQDAVDELRDEKGKLRDMLELLVEHFEECDPAKAEEMLKVLYPIRAKNTDGDTVYFEGEQY